MADIPADPPAAPARGHAAFGRDVGLLTMVRFAAVGAGFLTSILAARVLGPSELGAAGIGLTIGAIAALVANGGLNIASTYFLGRRPAERRAIAHRSLTLAMAASSLAAILVLLVVGPFAERVFGAENAGLVGATAVLAAGIVAFEVGGAILLGLDLRPSYLVTQTIEGIGSFAVTAAVVLLVAPTAAGMVIAAGLAYLLAATFAGVMAQRSVGGRILAFDRAYTREALALGLRGQVGNILQFLNLRLDLLLVPLLIDLRAAGIYLIAVRMSEVVTQISSAASALLFPAVSRSDPTLTGLTERTMRATLLLVVVAGTCIGIAAPLLLTVFFGQAYEAGASALRITMLAMVPLAISRLLAGDMKGRGRAGLVSVSAGAALIATVILDLLLIPMFGIEGAAMASLLAYSAGALTLLIAYRTVTGGSLLRFVPTVADARLLATVPARVARRGRYREDGAQPQ